MSQNHKQHSARAIKRAVKHQKKDLRKIIDNQRWIEYRTDAVVTADYPAPLADSYNQRDQKRIDKLVARMEQRALKYGIATYKPPADEADTPRKVAEPQVADTEVEASAAEALRQEAQALYDRGAITESALQLAHDVADAGDINCICRSVENLRGATRRADKVKEVA